MSYKKQKALVKNIKACDTALLVPVLIENAEQLAELAGVPAEQLRAELSTDPLAPFRYFAVTQLLKLQGGSQTQTLESESEEQLLAAFNDSPNLQVREDAAILHWLSTGSSAEPLINA